MQEPSKPSSQHAVLRKLPAIHRLAALLDNVDGTVACRVARDCLSAVRRDLLSGEAAEVPSLHELAWQCRTLLDQGLKPSLQRVINGTGILLHTGLGRAPIHPEAVESARRAMTGYANLEIDLKTMARGERQSHLLPLLRRLSGSEDALVVNNNAAAALLVLATLCSGREAILSRGELVEIGGGFRIPEVMRQSGAILREVGTTNRTHLSDYKEAIGGKTGLLCKVHRSNFDLVGHVAEVSIEQLARLGKRTGIPVYFDAGSASVTRLHSLEPTLEDLANSGIDLVSLSGDKSLGGPQAGIILGRRKLLEQLRTHPLARAFRIGKGTVSTLEKTLALYQAGRAEEIPVVAMARATEEELRERGARITAGDFGEIRIRPVPSVAHLGGGSAPQATFPSVALALEHARFGPDALKHRLATAATPILGRIHENRLLLDLRTVLPPEDALIRQTLLTVGLGK